MKKILNFTGFTLLVVLLFYVGTLIANKYTLRNDLIRLHVVANSDNARDQRIKIAVKDAVIAYIREQIPNIDNADDARLLLTEQLQNIQEIANDVLTTEGSVDRATVTLCKEKFGIRVYDTFSLPSGIYESLRIEIGDAEGKNWWCVVFPALCVPTSSSEFVETAASAGFDPALAESLANNDGFEVRFILLDILGKVENFFAFS